MSNEQILELRRVMVAYLSKQLTEEIMRIDDEHGYTAEDYEQMLNEPS